MSDYSKEEQLKVKQKKWLEEFENSKFYSCLESKAQEKADLLLNRFFELLSSKLSLEPEEWLPASVRDYCLYLVEDKLSKGRDKYRYLPETAAALFRFLEANSSLEQADKLAEVLEEVPDYRFSSSEGVPFDSEEVVALKEYCIKRDDEKPAVSTIQQEYNKARDKAWDRIFNFFLLIKEEYQAEIARYYDRFSEISGIDITEGLPEEVDSFLLLFFIFDQSLEGEKGVIDLLLERRKERIPDKEREILKAWTDLPLKLYLIRSMAGDEYELIDIFAGEEIIVINRAESLDPGEILVGRVAPVGMENQLIGPYNTLPGEYKDLLVEHIEDKFIAYKKRTGNDNFHRFLREESIVLVDLFKSVHEFKDQEIRFIYEACYEIQSRELVRKKLLSSPQVRAEEIDEVDVLLWLEKIEGSEEISGNFLLDEDELYLRTHRPDKLEAGKEFIKELLSFIAIYKEEYKADLETGRIVEYLSDRPKEVSNKLTDNFLESSLTEDGKPPLELLETKKGKEELLDYINQMELMAEFAGAREDFFSPSEVDMIKEKLGLEVDSRDLLKDGVEEVLAKRMKERDFSGEVICEAILLWRDYKEKTSSLKGKDKSWAAAVEYLLSRINYWLDSQEEVGREYGVSPTTVSKKYRKLAEVLDFQV